MTVERLELIVPIQDSTISSMLFRAVRTRYTYDNEAITMIIDMENYSQEFTDGEAYYAVIVFRGASKCPVSATLHMYDRNRNGKYGGSEIIFDRD